MTVMSSDSLPSPPVTAASPSVDRPSSKLAGNKRRRGRALRIVRRVHMYAGLLLMPWLMFFGLSGMLFNHPNIGEKVDGQRVTSAELAKLSALKPWDARAAASAVVDQLNQTAAARGPYRVDPEFESEFSGYAILNAPAPDGGHMLILDVAQARGVLVHKVARKSADGSSFPRLQLPLEAYSSQALERHTKGLLEARALPHASELHAHPKIAPELRLRVLDAEGVRWNLTYDTREGALAGRREDSFPNLGIAQIMGSMHKTHHFTMEVGALWLWALFEDLLGLAMVLWAVTGLVMWWQLKRTRVLGVASLLLALGIAAAVMTGTLQELTFGDVRAAMGPGD